MTTLGAPTQPAGGAPKALDPTIVNLAKAIRETETRGAKDPYTAKGGSGEFGAYQYTPTTWSADVKAFTGKDVPLEKADKLLQNEVAYKKLESLKKQGYNVGQIASIWNSGSPEWEGKTGTNKFGVKYDVPQYVDSVARAYQTLKAGGAPVYGDTASTVKEPQAQAPAPTEAQSKDAASAQKYGAFFPAATGDTPLEAGLKTAGNLIPSAFNFAKGTIEALNPISIAKNIAAIPGEFGALVKESGGVGNALKAFGSELLPTAYQTVVPEAVRSIAAGDLEGAARAIENDPFGQIAPLVIGAKYGARGLDRAGATTGAEAAVEGAVSRTAAPVISGAKTVFGKPAAAVAATGRYAVAKASGLSPDTIKAVTERPQDFTKEAVASASRASLGEDIKAGFQAKNPGITPEGLGGELKAAIDTRTSALGETGAEYKPIRASGATVKVEPSFLQDAIGRETGLVLRKGKWTATAKSAVDKPGDVAAVQRLYDAWQPFFKKGALTADDFLTLRGKLGKLAYNDVGLRSGDMAKVGNGVRVKLNAAYRDQIPKLAEADADFSTLSQELKTLTKGLFDKEGNLTDAGLSRLKNATAARPRLMQQLEDISPGIAKKVQAMQDFKEATKGLLNDKGELTDTAVNRIANAAGKGKDALLARLEEIRPGIGLKIRQLKAIEDIQNIHKVGTYSKGIIEGEGSWGASRPATWPSSRPP